MLAALGRFYHWSRADLLSLTPEEADWWAEAMVSFHEATKPKGPPP